MFGWIRNLFKGSSGDAPRRLRAVPGAGVVQAQDGRVIYNFLDPGMQQFMGNCVGAVKRAGIRAKGTGQFSILLGEDRKAELRLDDFWAELQQSEDRAVFEKVAAAAQELAGG